MPKDNLKTKDDFEDDIEEIKSSSTTASSTPTHSSRTREAWSNTPSTDSEDSKLDYRYRLRREREYTFPKNEDAVLSPSFPNIHEKPAQRPMNLREKIRQERYAMTSLEDIQERRATKHASTYLPSITSHDIEKTSMIKNRLKEAKDTENKSESFSLPPLKLSK